MSDEFKINLEDLNPQEKPEEKKDAATTVGIKKTPFLQDMPLSRIASVFSELRINDEDVTMVIPIGFPQAGKSLFLSSMLHYAARDENNLFELTRIKHAPFKMGDKTADDMINYFSSRKIYASNKMGTLDLIGLNVKPRLSGRPELNLAFLDLAGEDIKNIKTSIRGEFTNKINAVFNGLQANLTPVLFFLITPFSPPNVSDDESDREAHVKEDALHTDFLDYLEQKQPEIYGNCKIFIIVTQWDKNLNPKMGVEDFMAKHRTSLYNKVRSKNVVWGSYSVGRLLNQSDDDGSHMQELVQINSDYPQRLWKKLYYICTHKHLESWWTRLLS
jgi:hypothetical protein